MIIQAVDILQSKLTNTPIAWPVTFAVGIQPTYIFLPFLLSGQMGWEINDFTQLHPNEMGFYLRPGPDQKPSRKTALTSFRLELFYVYWQSSVSPESQIRKTVSLLAEPAVREFKVTFTPCVIRRCSPRTGNSEISHFRLGFLMFRKIRFLNSSNLVLQKLNFQSYIKMNIYFATSKILFFPTNISNALNSLFSINRAVEYHTSLNNAFFSSGARQRQADCANILPVTPQLKR